MEQLLNELEGVPNLDSRFEAFLREVRPYVRTALVRNAGPAWRHRQGSYLQLDELFDAVLVSGEVGVAKPDPAIYTMTASSLGVAPPECIFVDDRPEFVAGAGAAGMIGVEVTTVES